MLPPVPSPTTATAVLFVRRKSFHSIRNDDASVGLSEYQSEVYVPVDATPPPGGV